MSGPKKLLYLLVGFCLLSGLFTTLLYYMHYRNGLNTVESEYIIEEVTLETVEPLAHAELMMLEASRIWASYDDTWKLEVNSTISGIGGFKKNLHIPRHCTVCKMLVALIVYLCM